MILTDRFQEKKLKNLNINIISKYLDNGTYKNRSTDNSYCDDVVGGILINKKYIKDDKMLHEEKEFNPRILYSYIVKEELDKEHTCPNCGATFTPKETTVCPYCRSIYNLDYTEKELSARYHYDQIIHNYTYIAVTLLIDFIVCEIFSFIYFYNTGRTFMMFDMLKAFGFGLLFTLIFFYAFYVLDAVIITLPVKIIKNKENSKKIKVWNELEKLNVNKKEFFNNFNSSLYEHYYKPDNDIIDYDVLDYKEYSYFNDDKNRLNIKVTISVRIVRLVNNIIKSEVIDDTLVLRKNEIEQSELDKGLNLIKCHNCGASIDASKSNCSYCRTPVHYLQSWYIVEK